MLVPDIIIKGKGPRKTMQDYCQFGQLEKHSSSWMIVCDGIGGQPGGDRAAQICCNTLDTTFKREVFDNNTLDLSSLIKKAMFAVADNMQQHILKNMHHIMMGTTLAGVICTNQQCIAFWSGDSRIYQFRNSKCIWRSLPHNPVFDDYRAGKTKLQVAEATPSNIITKHIVGSGCFHFVEQMELQIKEGDRIIVCSDGFWNTIKLSSISMLIKNTDHTVFAEKVQSILNTKANDNYCALVASVKNDVI